MPGLILPRLITLVTLHYSPLRIVLLQTEARVALVAMSKPVQSVDDEVQLLPKL